MSNIILPSISITKNLNELYIYLSNVDTDQKYSIIIDQIKDKLSYCIR